MAIIPKDAAPATITAITENIDTIKVVEGIIDNSNKISI